MNSYRPAVTVLLLITLALIAVPAIQGDGLVYEFEVEKATPLGNESLQEVSGVTRSHLFPDTFWAHNDSGDKARLFAITQEGEVICPPFLRACPSSAQGTSSVWEGHTIEIAMNYDWEDIAVLDGHLLIADTGNNGNARRDLESTECLNSIHAPLIKRERLPFIRLPIQSNRCFQQRNGSSMRRRSLSRMGRSIS